MMDDEQPPSCSSSSSSSSSRSTNSTNNGFSSSISSSALPSPSSTSTQQPPIVQQDIAKLTLDLTQQCWYWGAASKEEISAAMESQQNGTFTVRDATTKGQYTLTLRIDNMNKLIKILVDDRGKCGFTQDCMDFESVPSLVQFYRTCSLRDFNERLDTCLLHPLESPQWMEKQSGGGDKTNQKAMDPVYRISLLKCRLEGLHSEYDRVSRRYDQLFGQRTALADEFRRKQQTATAYADALKIFDRKIGELKRTISEEEQQQGSDGELMSERDHEALAMNIELQEERMEEIDKAQTLMNTAIQNIGRSLGKIDEESEKELKPKLLKLHKKRDKCRDKLLTMPKQHQVTHAQLDRLVQGVSLALDSEPSSLSTFLLRTSLGMPQWDCEHWLWHPTTKKEQSIALIRALMPNPASDNGPPRDGIFLIRPSTSRPGFYALEISKDGTVHSCLIEYRDPRTVSDHCGGYGFAQTQMLFASLIDFVRYYSMVSLKEHNPVLDTSLVMPALGLHKREQRRMQKVMERADDRRSGEKINKTTEGKNGTAEEGGNARA